MPKGVYTVTARVVGWSISITSFLCTSLLSTLLIEARAAPEGGSSICKKGFGEYLCILCKSKAYQWPRGEAKPRSKSPKVVLTRHSKAEVEGSRAIARLCQEVRGGYTD